MFFKLSTNPPLNKVHKLADIFILVLHRLYHNLSALYLLNCFNSAVLLPTLCSGLCLFN